MNHGRVGLLVFVFSSIPVWLGLSFGSHLLVLHETAHPPDFLTACSRYDGCQYAAIVKDGYSYDRNRASTVAYFPAYPFAASLLATMTAWDPRLALLVVSNVSLLAYFVAFSAYLPARGIPMGTDNPCLVLALFAVFPAGFFFRMTYSESTFVLLTLLALSGIARDWPLPAVAILSGLATAARPVGLAVAAAVSWHILSQADGGSRSARVIRAAVYLPLATSGLLAYMAYQWYSFDTPLAFAQTQDNWTVGGPPDDLADKAGALLSAEPIIAPYTSDPIRGWERMDCHNNPFFSIFFWNPILFVLALALVLFGARQSWLTGPETVLGIGLLAIPYVTRAYEMSMASHARFAAVVIPAYIVLGRVLAAAPEWLRWCVLCAFAVMLFAWSALFAAGYPLF